MSTSTHQSNGWEYARAGVPLPNTRGTGILRADTDAGEVTVHMHVRDRGSRAGERWINTRGVTGTWTCIAIEFDGRQKPGYGVGSTSQAAYEHLVEQLKKS